MNYNNLTGRYFGNDVFSTKAENGMWTVTVVIKERVTDDGVNWVEESIGAEATDMDFDVAHKMALRVTLQELDRIVYQKGFDSLVEAVEADRLSKDKESDVKDNKDSYLQ